MEVFFLISQRFFVFGSPTLTSIRMENFMLISFLRENMILVNVTRTGAPAHRSRGEPRHHRPHRRCNCNFHANFRYWGTGCLFYLVHRRAIHAGRRAACFRRFYCSSSSRSSKRIRRLVVVVVGGGGLPASSRCLQRARADPRGRLFTSQVMDILCMREY